MPKSLLILFSILLVLSTMAAGCGKTAPSLLILATTTSTYDSGLLNTIVPVFEEMYPYKIHVISLGTGQALEIAKNGDADVVLVHDRATELTMVEQGYFVDRFDVMYNDFVLVGPAGDPAALKEVSDMVTALAAIEDKQSIFISRGDNSGTHKKERSLWQAAGITPQGNWHVSAGAGMGEALRMTDEMGGYTLTDRATYLSMRDNLELVIVFEGTSDLLNQYGVMAVNPANYEKVNYDGAKAFIEFLRSAQGQESILNYKPYGEPLFFPTAQ